MEPLLDDLLSDRETMFDGFSKRSQRLRGTTPDKDALEIHFELIHALLTACPQALPTFKDMKKLLIMLNNETRVFGVGTELEKIIDTVADVWRTYVQSAHNMSATSTD